MGQSTAAERFNLTHATSPFLLAAAEARGLEAGYTDEPDLGGPGATWLEIVVGGRPYLFTRGMILERGRAGRNPLGRHINESALHLVAYKHQAKTFLAERGFAVPHGLSFHRRDLDAARGALDAFDGPVCLKPEAGKGGYDVVTGISDRARFHAVLDRLAASYQRILVEEYIDAQPIRFFYIRPDVVAVKLNRPASVVGDGASTVAALFAARNRERRRRALVSHIVTPLDDEAREILNDQGLGPDDVPERGRRVFLRWASNESIGGDAINLTDQIHPSYAALIAEACRTVPGLHITAVDAMITDIAQPAAPGNHWILELNGSPGYSPFCAPWEGEPVDIAGMIIDYLATDYPTDAD